MRHLRLVLLAALGAVGSLCASDRAGADDATPPIPADKEVVTTASGLKYSVLVAGPEGKHPKVGDKVKVHYTGWLTDGKVFDSSRLRGEPTEFQLGGVIPGWNEGLALMSVGSRYKFTIPPNLAYGDEGQAPDIPGKATLIFDVELLGVTWMPEFRAAKPDAQKTTASGLKYEVLKEGEGTPPAEGDAFEMRFALWSTAGKLLDCTENSGKTIKGRTADMAFGILKEAPSLLKPGSRYRFEAPAALAFGERTPGPDLPPNSVTVWELEMVRVITPLPLPAFSAPEGAPKSYKTASGLEVQVLREGTGRAPKMADEVTVQYAGWLANGTLFDASYTRGEPAQFQLARVIPGWSEGIQTMKEGGMSRFTIPGAIAYGPEGRPPRIPPNATLVFVVELIRIGGD